MPRNRFQLLLRMWRFSDNASCPEGDHLLKLKPLLDKLVEDFQAVYTPGRTFYIDECYSFLRWFNHETVYTTKNCK